MAVGDGDEGGEKKARRDYLNVPSVYPHGRTVMVKTPAIYGEEVSVECLDVRPQYYRSPTGSEKGPAGISM
jgi:hypothetical protein